MATRSERLAVLPAAEQFALYSLPDFDDGQRLVFLSLSEQELALACSRPGLHAQAYCALQISYFKAKHAFFHFTWDDAVDDVAFVLTRYFDSPSAIPHSSFSKIIGLNRLWPITAYSQGRTKPPHRSLSKIRCMSSGE